MIYVEFTGNAGYAGTDYEEYMTFEDDTTEAEINATSDEIAYDNAETFEYVARGWAEKWDSEEEKEEYYDTALSYCGWNYISKEEYEESY